MIDPELAAFLQDGLAIHIGTRNEQLEPNGARALAVAVDPDRQHLVVYIAGVAATRLLPDLRSNGQVAVAFVRPVDDRACQLKGAFVEARPADPEEVEVIRAQRERFLAHMERIGIPRDVMRDWIAEPALAIRLRATAVFDQTPGPSAGAPLSH